MTDHSDEAPITFEEFATRLDDELCTWPAEPQLFTRANALDQWPDPITPLTQDLVELPQERGLESAFVAVLGVCAPSPDWTWNGCFYGYVMFGVTPAAGLADNLPGWNRAGVYADYLGVRPDPDAAPESGPKPNLLSLLRIGKNFVAALRDYPRRAETEIRAGRAQLAEDLARNWPAVSDSYLRARIAGFPALATRQREPHAVASVIGAALFKRLTETVVKLAGADEGPRLATEIITPLGGVHLGEAVKAMASVASGRLDRADFLREYGFRGTNEFELAARPWADDPVTLNRLIEAAARPGAAPSDVRTAARARVQRLAGRRWPLIRRQLAFTEKHLRWRENGKIPMALGVASIRLAVREAGRRLVERGRLADPSDVCYLRAAELLDELDGTPPPEVADTIGRRPTGLARITDERWTSLGLLPPETSGADPDALTGVAGAHGRVTGRARIVFDPNEIEIDEGDILVARGTDSAWTPLFMQADAVIIDIGGVMSHACIAAREMGIPCVIDVKHGTTRIAEGQKITVDGDAGIVTLH
jgi:phosphohistidine swiveling domain-containing protein